MKLFTYLYFVIALLCISSCSNRTENAKKNQQILNDSVCDTLLKEKEIVNVDSSVITTNFRNDKVISIQKLVANYPTSFGDPDTSICIFLYVDFDRKARYEMTYIQYFRLFTEYDKIEPLFENLFSCMSDYDKKKGMLKTRKNEILEYSRNDVKSTFDEFGTTDGPYYEFLKEIKDKTLTKYEN